MIRLHQLVLHGYFRIYILLRREGWRITHKRVYRLYRAEGLSMRLKRPRRHVTAAHRVARPGAGKKSRSHCAHQTKRRQGPALV